MSRSDVVRIPRKTLLGSLLCRFGYHAWIKTGAVQKVMPTGNALLITERQQPFYCQRAGCEARRVEVWKREGQPT